MSRRFSNIPMLEAHTRFEKGVMLPLQSLIIDGTHKMMLLRKHKCTEVYFLTLWGSYQNIETLIHQGCFRDSEPGNNTCSSEGGIYTTSKVEGTTCYQRWENCVTLSLHMDSMDHLHVTYRLEHTEFVDEMLGSRLSLPTLRLCLKLRGQLILLI
ncbi:hypothetical protein H5410_045169 [Solanum commersonii]|uniref:Uncharacterized protein n=1 Tax=Solanum commersonii TaxID=4109 RepID=A0A9J5XAS4_SOLCO|nr:hypothetical protein H5410_045169 [Solanum commersonii]